MSRLRVYFHALALEVAPLPGEDAAAGRFGDWRVCARAAEAIAPPAEPTLVRVRTGVGPRAARLSAERLPPTIAIEAAVCGGFAGALVPGLQPGTLVIADPLLDAEGRTIATSLAPALAQAAERAGLLFARAALVTASEVAHDPEAKAALRARSGAVAVDMESAALAHALAARGAPVGVARVVIDGADEAVPPTGHPAAALAAMLRSPRALASGVRMARRVRPCARVGAALVASWLTADAHDDGRAAVA